MPGVSMSTLHLIFIFLQGPRLSAPPPAHVGPPDSRPCSGNGVLYFSPSIYLAPCYPNDPCGPPSSHLHTPTLRATNTSTTSTKPLSPVSTIPPPLLPPPPPSSLPHPSSLPPAPLILILCLLEVYPTLPAQVHTNKVKRLCSCLWGSIAYFTDKILQTYYCFLFFTPSHEHILAYIFTLYHMSGVWQV